MEDLVLTPGQIAQLSIVVTLITQGLFVLANFLGVNVKSNNSTNRIRLFVGVIALLYGFFIAGGLPALPDFSSGDLLAIVGEVIAFATALVFVGGQAVAYAGLVYDYVAQGVFAWLDNYTLGLARRRGHLNSTTGANADGSPIYRWSLAP